MDNDDNDCSDTLITNDTIIWVQQRSQLDENEIKRKFKLMFA